MEAFHQAKPRSMTPEERIEFIEVEIKTIEEMEKINDLSPRQEARYFQLLQLLSLLQLARDN